MDSAQIWDRDPKNPVQRLKDNGNGMHEVGQKRPNALWTVAEAKAKFSEVIEKARSEGPQRISRRGRMTAVLVAAEEWERKVKRKGNLAEFFAASPLRGSRLKIRRLSGAPRKVDL